MRTVGEKLLGNITKTVLRFCVNEPHNNIIIITIQNNPFESRNLYNATCMSRFLLS